MKEIIITVHHQTPKLKQYDEEIRLDNQNNDNLYCHLYHIPSIQTLFPFELVPLKIIR